VKYLVDSDWVADWLYGAKSAVQLLTSLRHDGLAISVITYGEIYEGIHFGHDPMRSLQLFRNFLRRTSVLGLNRPIMQRFAIVRGSLRRQGQLNGDADLLIAATALHHDLTLLTRNARHFQRVPELKLHPTV
jgi:predicted nucleic acid-binding protein